MSANVLIGVGGTGAKVVESALYLMLAGLGPQQVFVGLVDQDNANGNGTRTLELINRIVEFQSDFNGPTHRLDWESDPDAGGTVLGKVRIEKLFPDRAHWRPNADANGTLAQILDKGALDPDRRALLDLLFLDSEEEQLMSLSKGYRGRAHVGAASMLASLELTDTQFMQRLRELMRQETVSQDLRIFLAGSVFGGTGAAGFPTLARRLDAARRDKDFPHGKRVRLGGALMLPYFRFADSADPADNVVRTDELIPQAKAALDYYDGLFDSEPVFDRLYLGGWNDMFHLDYHSPGDLQQRNPPLPPELIGAQAVLDFFQTALPDDLPRSVDVQVSSRAADHALSWTDLPLASNALLPQTYDRIGQLLRTAVYWLYSADSELFKRGRFTKTPAWVKELTFDVDFGPDTSARRERLTELFTDVLEWAASMQLFARRPDRKPLRFGLWNTDKAVAQARENDFARPVDIHPPGARFDWEAAYDEILTPLRDGKAPSDSDDIYRSITNADARGADGKNAGLGRFLAAVHRLTTAHEGDAR